MMQEGSGHVKKETMLLVALAALVTGFLAGIVFSVYKAPTSPPATMQRQAGPPQGMPSQQGFSQEQANKILALEKEVTANPGNVEAWIMLGNIWFDTHKYKKAIKAYAKALELEPNNANVLTDLGVMYRRNGQPKEALASFDKAILVNPKHEVTRFNKGIVLLHDLNDAAGAVKAWEELVRVNPSAMAPNGQPIKEMIEELKKRSKDSK